jgi:hypothetical protein
MITSQPRTRQVIRILEKSAAARHAQDSPMSIVEFRVTKAFSCRLKARGKNDFKPRLLALVTLSIMKAAVSVWSRSDRENMRVVIREALPTLHQALS